MDIAGCVAGERFLVGLQLSAGFIRNEYQLCVNTLPEFGCVLVCREHFARLIGSRLGRLEVSIIRRVRGGGTAVRGQSVFAFPQEKSRKGLFGEIVVRGFWVPPKIVLPLGNRMRPGCA